MSKRVFLRIIRKRDMVYRLEYGTALKKQEEAGKEVCHALLEAASEIVGMDRWEKEQA